MTARRRRPSCSTSRVQWRSAETTTGWWSTYVVTTPHFAKTTADGKARLEAAGWIVPEVCSRSSSFGVVAR